MRDPVAQAVGMFSQEMSPASMSRMAFGNFRVGLPTSFSGFNGCDIGLDWAPLVLGSPVVHRGGDKLYWRIKSNEIFLAQAVGVVCVGSPIRL